MRYLNSEKEIPQSQSALWFKKKFLNLKFFNKILFILIIVLGISYIAGTNDLAIKGYALSDLRKQQSKVAAENKKLELKAMSLSSYNVLSKRIGSLKMVAVGNIDYIDGGDGSVAKK